MSNLQQEYDSKRQQNLNHEISHNEFYCWLADEIRINNSDLPVPIERIQQSTDEHLNDIPLAKWDACDPWVRRKAGAYGMRSWSLSDTVCVLKAYGRRAAQQAAA